MNYMDGMRCETNPIETCCEEVALRIRLEETQRALQEMQSALQSIIISMTNAPKPECKEVDAQCLNDQALINYNLSCDCRGMVMRIKELLFGRGIGE